jgi:hypothetical protein
VVIQRTILLADIRNGFKLFFSQEDLAWGGLKFFLVVLVSK